MDASILNYTVNDNVGEFLSKDKKVNLVVVGPEDPLVNGITDQFSAEGINCFGPSAIAAQLEGSKEYSKMFMQKYRIPTANYSSFNNALEAKKYVKNKTYPLVIKADGLAAGKGVIVCNLSLIHI